MAGEAGIRYADHCGAHLAFRTWGEGPPLLFVLSQFIPVTAMDEEPALEHFLSSLASFSTVIAFDRQGVGLSDPMTATPSLEDWSGQLESVMTAAGFESVFVVAHAFGGIPALHLAATRPERVRGLVFAIAASRWRSSEEDLADVIATVRPGSTHRPVDFLAQLAPSRADDPAFRRWWDDAGRRGASPAVAGALLTLNARADATEFIGAVRQPTLVIRRPDYVGPTGPTTPLQVDVPGARVVDVGGIDLLPWLPDSDAVVSEIEDFVTGDRRPSTGRRAVLTVMFSDVVSSTGSAVRLGDRHWTDVLEVHDRLVRRELLRHDGTDLDTAGDGFLATFATPTNAVRCARRLHRVIGEIGLQLRIGIHCGEIEMREDDIAGIAVHIAARVQTKAGPGETLVTSTVREMLMGSDVPLALKGRYALKGVPGRWALFADSDARSPGSV